MILQPSPPCLSGFKARALFSMKHLIWFCHTFCINNITIYFTTDRRRLTVSQLLIFSNDEFSRQTKRWLNAVGRRDRHF